MVTFRAWVKYIDKDVKTTDKGHGTYKYHAIETMDVDTRRHYWFYDWSGYSDNWKEMEKHKDEIIYIEGYLNAMSRINYAVMQRWAIWDTHTSTPINPFTGKKGFVEVIERFKVRNEND